jgi:chemotaxis protein CheX
MGELSYSGTGAAPSMMRLDVDTTYINPFVRSTTDTFSMMLGTEVDVGEPELKIDGRFAYEISGIIGMSGDAEGIIGVNFPRDVALKIVSKLIGSECTSINLMVTDGIGEIANIIAGNAKQYFSGKALLLGLPYVIISKGGQTIMSKDIPVYIVPLKSVLGEFSLEIALRIS